MIRIGTTCLLAALGFATAAPALTVEEIVQRTNDSAYYGGDDGKARATMIISDKEGRTREREFTILRKDVTDGGEQYYYVYFHRPGDVRKTVFMVHKHIGSADDRWLYLPALDLVRRIAASDKRTSFVGSHFYYEDVSGRGIQDDTHTLAEEAGEQYVLENVPKDPGSVEFSRYVMWIDKGTFLPVKAEYYDRQDKLYRRMQVLKTAEVQGVPTVLESRMEDLNSGGSTVMAFEKVEYNVGISEDIFTERYLRRPPREFVQR